MNLEEIHTSKMITRFPGKQGVRSLAGTQAENKKLASEMSFFFLNLELRNDNEP